MPPNDFRMVIVALNNLLTIPQSHIRQGRLVAFFFARVRFLDF